VQTSARVGGGTTAFNSKRLEGTTLMIDDEWERLYDVSNPVHDSIARMTGFHDNPSSDTFADYLEHLRIYNDAALRIGKTGMNQLANTPKVTDRRLKWKLMAGWLREGRAWVAIEDGVGISHLDQCYVISNGRDTALVAWDEDLQIECEQDIRSGMSAYRIHQIYQVHGLTDYQARALVRLFRGPD